MHILIVPSWYTSSQNPIRGSFFRDQALALHHHGHQVGMLVPPSRFRTFNGLREFIANWHKRSTDISISNDEGIMTYRMPWWGWLPSVMPQLRGNLFLRLFDEYCVNHGVPDILHGHSILYGGYLAAYIGQRRKIASLVTEHSSLFLTSGYQLGHQPFIRYTLSHVDKVLAVGESLVRALQVYNPHINVDIIGNVVDTNLFVPPSTLPPPVPFIISIFGRLDHNKAQNLLLQAFAQALKGKDAQLHIVGDGQMRKQYERLCSQLALGSQVTFFGQLPREAVIRMMQESHVVVSSSTIETFGVTLIEAMACGKPVIATRSGGPEYFIDDSDGLLVPSGDVESLAQAMLTMYVQHSQYDAQDIRARCIARFSEEAIAQQLETLYEELR
ncbi:MAG: glycosyltransferase [Anaerolineae bacterium]|nr:glycosyltransferase [Anaerolineae bacterium]